MDALPGFYQIKNIPDGFQYFLSSRVLPLALFGEATIVVYEECRTYLEPYYSFFPALDNSVVYVSGEGPLADRVLSGGVADTFPEGAVVYTTYPSERLLPLVTQCKGVLAGYNSKYPDSAFLHKGIFYPVWGEEDSELACKAREFDLSMPAGYLVQKGDLSGAKAAFTELQGRYDCLVSKPSTETGNGDGVTVGAELNDLLTLVEAGNALITQAVQARSVVTPTGYKTELSLSVCGVDGQASVPSLQIVKNGSWVGCFAPAGYEELGISQQMVNKAIGHVQWVLDVLEIRSSCGFDLLVDTSGECFIVDFNFRFPGSHTPVYLGKRQISSGQPVLYEPFELYGTNVFDIMTSLSQKGLLLNAEGAGILPLSLPCSYR